MLDLAYVRERLEAAAEIVERLDGLDLVDTDMGNPSSGKRRTSERRYAAAVSRELMHLTDHLNLTAALVREQYWNMKGLDQ
jgi:hypothetical protein